MVRPVPEPPIWRIERLLGHPASGRECVDRYCVAHLSRPLRRLWRWIIGLGAIASVALGASVAVGTLAGLLIGIAGAATAHLIFGSPGGQLSLEEVSRGLAGLGVAAGELRVAAQDPRGAAIVFARTDDDRPLVVKIFGRDARQGQLISSTWASLRRRGEIVRISTGWQQAQHEAFVSLFAERGGVPVMPVVAAGTPPEGDAFLVLDADAQPLASLTPDQIDDRAIEELWLAFQQLGRLGVAMGRVDGHGCSPEPTARPRSASSQTRRFPPNGAWSWRTWHSYWP